MMKDKIKTAFEHATPDIYDDVVRDIQNQKGKVIPMTKKSNRWFKRTLAVAAAFALVITGAFTADMYRNSTEVFAKVALDVNPGVEIQLKKNNKVKAVVPRNADGEKILDDMDFAGSDLKVTLNALVGSMVRHGYLSDLSNSILVSVEGQDAAKNAELQTMVSAEIEKILGGSNLESAVLSQTVAEDDEIQKLADEYGISRGKAQIIQKIADKNKQYKIADLAGLTINELNLLSEGKGQHIDKVTATGTASSKAYIGTEKAKSIAFEKAGVKAANVRDLEVDLDMENGVMVYEVDFDTAKYEFEFEIDAKTGKILNMQKEPVERDDVDDDDDDDDDRTAPTEPSTNNNNNNTTTTYIGKAKAKTIALNHAGVKAANARDMEVEFDTENGVKVYEVSFETSEYEYDYTINAKTGKVIHVEKERQDDNGNNNNNNNTTTSYIGKAKAKSIALNHAKVKAANARGMEVELDKENGVAVYEVSFEAGGYEYDYEINAKTGKIIKSEKERD